MAMHRGACNPPVQLWPIHFGRVKSGTAIQESGTSTGLTKETGGCGMHITRGGAPAITPGGRLITRGGVPDPIALVPSPQVPPKTSASPLMPPGVAG